MSTPLSLAIGNSMLNTVAAAATEPLGRAVLHIANWSLPNNLPSAGEIARAYYSGQLSQDAYQAALLAWGHSSTGVFGERYPLLFNGSKLSLGPERPRSDRLIWDAAQSANTWHPDLTFMIEAYRRGLIDDSLFAYWTLRLGTSQQQLPTLLKTMGQYLPGVQDLVRFAVREVFNVQQRQILHLDDEYDQNPDFKVWANALGMTEVTIVDQAGQQYTRDIAKDFWAAHWQLPAPGQIFEMLHRLRPGRTPHFAVGGVIPDPVDVDFMRAAIKANDYSPTWRDRLAAIAYRLPGRVDIRRMLGTGIIDLQETINLYMDLGYTTADATNLAKLAQKLGPWKPTIAKAAKWNYLGFLNDVDFTSVLDTYGIDPKYRNAIKNDAQTDVNMATLQRWRRRNIINDQQFTSKAKYTGYSTDDIQTFLAEAKRIPWSRYTQLTREQIAIALRLGIMTADEATQRLVTIGLTTQEAQAAVAVIQLEIANKFVDTVVKGIRRGYLRGEFTQADARGRLAQAGVDATRAGQYLATWQVELDAGRKELSAQQAVNAWVRGILSQAQVVSRLSNLNYSFEAIETFIAMGAQNIQKATAMAAIKAARSAAEQAKAAERIVRQNLADAKAARVELAKHGTPAQLKRWVVQGLIDETGFRNRLAALGWPLADIDRLWADATERPSGAGGSGKKITGTPPGNPP